MTFGDRLTAQEAKVASLEAAAHSGLAQISSLDAKMAKAEASVAAIESKLAALKSAEAPPPGKWQRFGQFLSSLFDALGKVVIPLAVVWFAREIKDSVDQALKLRELEVTEGKSMQDALTTLRAKDASQPAADAAALVLAAMGTPSIMILINEHNVGTTYAAVAVDNALFVLGASHLKELCDALNVVIGDTNGRFRVGTLKLAVVHIGTERCPDSVRALQALKSALADPAGRRARFRTDPTPRDIDELRDEVDRALARLGS